MVLSTFELYAISDNPSGATVALGVVAGMIIGQAPAVYRRGSLCSIALEGAPTSALAYEGFTDSRTASSRTSALACLWTDQEAALEA